MQVFTYINAINFHEEEEEEESSLCSRLFNNGILRFARESGEMLGAPPLLLQCWILLCIP
jgi:hypothetical protein